MEFDVLKAVADFVAIALALVAIVHTSVRTRDQATQSQLKDLRKDVGALREKGARLQAQLDETPSARALHEVAVAITEVAGEIKANSARLDGVTQLVARLDAVVERQETWLLQHGSRS